MKLFLVPLTLAAFVMALLLSCDDDKPVTPPPAGPDTTTHDWTFTLYEVGEETTVFYDLAALSSDFVLAVGELDHDSDPFPSYNNCYVWNGTGLSRLSLPVNLHDTATVEFMRWPNPSLPITSLWAFRRDNIWYASYGGFGIHLTTRGSDSMMYAFNYKNTTGDAWKGFGNSLWAIDSTDIYFGSMFGNVSHYKDGVLTKCDVDLKAAEVRSIWASGPDNVLVATIGNTFNAGLYRFDGTNWQTIWNETMPSMSDSVFFGAPDEVWGEKGDDSIWIGGLWIGRIKRDLTGKITPYRDVHHSGVRCIRGSAANNVFFVSSDGALMHYNGATIHEYTEFNGQRIDFLSVAVLPDEVFIVGGRDWGAGIFVHGRKRK